MNACSTLGAARVFPSFLFPARSPVISGSANFGYWPPARQKLGYRPRQGGWKCFSRHRFSAWLPDGFVFGMSPRTKDHDRECTPGVISILHRQMVAGGKKLKM
jgi:hypothetical protein